MKLIFKTIILATVLSSITNAQETVLPNKDRIAELESIIQYLMSDMTSGKKLGESKMKAGGYTGVEVWTLVEKAIDEKDSSSFDEIFQAFKVTGMTNGAIRQNVRKRFNLEKERIDTLLEWGDTINKHGPFDDPEARSLLHFETRYRELIILMAIYFLGADLDEKADVHPFLLPEMHVIMLTALDWIKKHGTDKSISILETIISKEPKNASSGGIADFANSALRAVTERKATN